MILQILLENGQTVCFCSKWSGHSVIRKVDLKKDEAYNKYE